MYKKRFQNNVATGRFTLPVVILICAAFWTATGFLFSGPYPDMPGTYPLWLSNGIRSMLPHWISQLISFIFYGFIGYLLIELNNTYAIIRTRATVQTSLYFILISICPFIHQIFSGSLVSFTMLISLFFLFKSYQSRRSSGNLFHAFAFIGISSLFLPQVLWLTPVWLIGAIMFHALTPRSLCASLVGIIFPYWIVFAFAFITDDHQLFYQPFIDMTTFTPISYFSYLSWEVIATLIYMFVLFLAAFVHRIINGHKNNIRTSAFLDFLILVSFSLLVYIVLQPSMAIKLLPLLIMFNSVLIGHIFAMTNSKASNIFFISSLAVLVLLFTFNLWMPF